MIQILKEYGYEKYVRKVLDISGIRTRINIQCLYNKYNDKNITKLSEPPKNSSKFIKSDNISAFSN